MYRIGLEANITFEMDKPPKTATHLAELLELVEKKLFEIYKDKFIKTKLGSVKPFFRFNHHFRPDKEKCPHSYPNEKHGTLARVIYGYMGDNDEAQDRDGKDLYLAGCVMDGFGIDIEGNWYYPTRYCNFCKTFSRYMSENSALKESP